MLCMLGESAGAKGALPLRFFNSSLSARTRQLGFCPLVLVGSPFLVHREDTDEEPTGTCMTLDAAQEQLLAHTTLQVGL